MSLQLTQQRRSGRAIQIVLPKSEFESALVTPRKTGRSGLGWSVGRDDDARGRHLAVEEPQRPERTVIAEQALAAPHHDRVNHHSELIDQIALKQRLHQLTAADHVQVLAVLLPQRGHGLGDVALSLGRPSVTPCHSRARSSGHERYPADSHDHFERDVGLGGRP